MSVELKPQDSAAPTRKMNGVLLGGGIASVVMGFIAIFFPEEYLRVPAGFEGGIAVIAGFIVGYFVTDRA